MKWEDISKNLPGRSAISCRLRFQNYLERRSEWDEEKKNKLARLYERFKKDMWEKIAKEMALPWRAAEAMHWQIGEVEMANRANVPVFHLAGQSSSQGPIATARVTPAPPTEFPRTSTSPNSGNGILLSPAATSENSYERGLPTIAQLTQSGYSKPRRGSDASMRGSEESSKEDGKTEHPQELQPASRPGTAGANSETAGTPQPRQYLSPFGGPQENNNNR